MRSSLFWIVARLSRSHKRALLLLVDAAIAPIALFVASALAFNVFFPLQGLAHIWPLFVAAAVLAGIVAFVLGMQRIKLNAYEARAVLKTAGFATLVMLGLAVVAQLAATDLPGAALVLFGMIFFLMSAGARVVMLHVLLWVLRSGRKSYRVLIYGAGDTGAQLVAALRSHDTIVPVAFVDDNPALHDVTIAGLRVLHPDLIEKTVRDREVDRVILAMPSLSLPKLTQIARRLQLVGLDVQMLPSFAQLIAGEKLIDNLTSFVPGQFVGRNPADALSPKGLNAYAGRSVLVTGAGGSVGSELCRQLLWLGPQRIVLFEVSEIALYNIDRELREIACGLPVEIVPVLGTVTDSRMARMVMTQHKIDVVFHAAAYKHVPLVEANPIVGLANNVLGTRTLADAAQEAKVARFIMISTDKAVRPTNIMGASKRLAELVIHDLAKRSQGTVFSTVRFGNVLGSSGSVVPLFKEQIARGGPLTLTHEDVTRYFMTLFDAAGLVLLAGSFAEAATAPEADVFVLDMGEPLRIRDLARQMIEARGYSVRDAANPDGDIVIDVIGLRPGEKLHEEVLIGEGFLTTLHPKILRAKESSLSELEMASALRALRSAVAAGDADAARAVVFSWVEGYQPPEVVVLRQ